MKRILLPLAALTLLGSAALTAQAPAGAAKIVGYETLPWGASRADVVRQKGQPAFENTSQVGPGMTLLAYTSDVGLIGYTVHERDGLIQVARSTTLEPVQCDATFDGIVEVFRDLLSPLEPAGRRENPTSDDLCTAVKAGKAQARYTWTDPANDATLTLEIKPGDGTLQMYLATPQYRRWYDSRHGTSSAAGDARQGNAHRTVNDLVAHLRAAGLNVTDVFGNEGIAGITIGGRKLTVIRFDGTAEGRAALDEIRRKGAIEFGGERYPSLVNDAWVIGIDAQHPQWRAIEAAFRTF